MSPTSNFIMIENSIEKMADVGVYPWEKIASKAS